jgi:hypothetical protein
MSIVTSPGRKSRSLTLQGHAQCSEAFYRETILSDLAADPSHSTDEKKRMMDILQRLQDGQEDDEDLIRQLTEVGSFEEGEGGGEGEGVGSEEDELARTLEGVDLGMSNQCHDSVLLAPPGSGVILPLPGQRAISQRRTSGVPGLERPAWIF